MTGGRWSVFGWLGLVVAMAVATFGMAGAAQAANPLSPIQKWTQQTPDHRPSVRFSQSMAFDPASGETVMFGGFLGGLLSDTWIWDGTDWTQESPATSPSARNAAAMAFDPNTGKMLLFGGITSGGASNQTWSWDGTNWTQLNPANSPPARAATSMAFDASTGQMVLFGGGGGILRNDTWTWNGTNWTQRSPATSPSVRQAGQMAFDPSTGDLVMFGGTDTGGYLEDTWIWTGTNWVEKSPLNDPTVQGGRGIAFDPLSGDLVLFGVGESNPNVSESWSWDGSDWTQLTSDLNPLPVNGPGMTYDAGSGNIVLFGGQAGASNNQTWTYGPPPGLSSAWFEQNPANKPSGRNASGSTFDEATGTTVMYGGYNGAFLNETWNWDGDDWSESLPATRPPGMQHPDVAFDPATGDAVLFAEGNTWSWSGTNWSQQSPPNSPSNRFYSALAFDPSMGKLLLFGGTNSSVGFDETWTWDGSTWTQLNPAHSPPARSSAAMAYDQSTGNMVLFGGDNRSDTWVWDGTDWTQMSPADHPSARTFAEMDFDPTSGDLVLYGGTDSGGEYPRDTWRWNGVNWIEQPGTAAPSRRAGPTMSFSPRSGGMVLFGGYSYDLGQQLNDTWTYELVADPPSAEITSPGSGGTYVIDESVPTAFTCADDGGGPGIAACVDSNGDASPGELDTSTLGTHTYSVTATSENGRTGQDEISYEVKALPTVTTNNPTNAAVGDPIRVGAEISGGYQPGGTLFFRTYGPDTPDCSGVPSSDMTVPVDGAGNYASPDFTPTRAGEYKWQVTYSGDGNNLGSTTTCGAPNSTSTVSKQTSIVRATSATSVNLSEPISVQASVEGPFGATGQVTFSLYGPGSPDCDASPIFNSDPVPLDGSGHAASPEFTPTATGDYYWVVEYNGDENLNPSRSPCAETGSISTVTDAPICPAVKLGFSIRTFKPNRRAINPQVPGVRIRIKTGPNVEADIKPSYRYRVNGKTRTAKLKARTVRVNGQRRLLFGIPNKMASQLRKATGQVSRNKATFRLGAILRFRGAGKDCDQNAGTKTLKTRISGVSSKQALRRLSSP